MKKNNPLRITPDLITSLSLREIFTFGSNKAGRHGLGAAKTAFELFEAEYGKGYGLQGRSFAIPTKDEHLNVLPLETINVYVEGFMMTARERKKELDFLVTEIGCGLAGYKPKDIAPLFYEAAYMENVWLPRSFRLYYGQL